jgi:hypothetical protein
MKPGRSTIEEEEKYFLLLLLNNTHGSTSLDDINREG